MKKYLYDIDDIPKEHQKFFRHTNKCIVKAFKKSRRLVKVHAGSYLVVINNELVSLNALKYEWIATEQSVYSKWYSDPYPTLKGLKKSLGL